MPNRHQARAFVTALALLLLSGGPSVAHEVEGPRGIDEPPSVLAAEAMAHEHDRLAFEPGGRVDVPLAARAASGLRRHVFGFLPSWVLGNDDLRLDYGGLTTIAIFGVQATRNGDLATHYSTGRPTSGWAAWWSSRTSSIIAAAHRAGTRVVLTVQRFAWTDGQVRDTETLLSSPTKRARLAARIADAIDDRGADGVNLVSSRCR